MKLIIDIPEEKYNKFMYSDDVDEEELVEAFEYLMNGTPLPKGHGRLIDADALIEKAPEIQKYLDVLAQTIIEADRSEE